MRTRDDEHLANDHSISSATHPLPYRSEQQYDEPLASGSSSILGLSGMIPADSTPDGSIETTHPPTPEGPPTVIKTTTPFPLWEESHPRIDQMVRLTTTAGPHDRRPHTSHSYGLSASHERRHSSGLMISKPLIPYRGVRRSTSADIVTAGGPSSALPHNPTSDGESNVRPSTPTGVGVTAISRMVMATATRIRRVSQPGSIRIGGEESSLRSPRSRPISSPTVPTFPLLPISGGVPRHGDRIGLGMRLDGSSISPGSQQASPRYPFEERRASDGYPHFNSPRSSTIRVGGPGVGPTIINRRPSWANSGSSLSSPHSSNFPPFNPPTSVTPSPIISKTTRLSTSTSSFSASTSSTPHTSLSLSHGTSTTATTPPYLLDLTSNHHHHHHHPPPHHLARIPPAPIFESPPSSPTRAVRFSRWSDVRTFVHEPWEPKGSMKPKYHRAPNPPVDVPIGAADGVGKTKKSKSEKDETGIGMMCNLFGFARGNRQ